MGLAVHLDNHLLADTPLGLREQDYPSQTVEVTAPYSQGGSLGLIARPDRWSSIQW